MVQNNLEEYFQKRGSSTLNLETSNNRYWCKKWKSLTLFHSDIAAVVSGSKDQHPIKWNEVISPDNFIYDIDL